MERVVEQFLSKHGQSEQLIVVFYATWFRPALAMKERLETLAEKENAMVFVDVDEAVELVEALKLPRVPAVYRFKDGEIVQRDF